MKIQSNSEVSLRAVNSLSVINQPIAALTPYEANARTHTNQQIQQIAESIRVFGFLNPVLVDAKNRIIAGHGRVQAASKVGMEQVPTIRIEGLSEEQIRAYIIADNKLAENAGWDRSILAIELQHLMTLDCADFDVTITGFEVAEIDSILEEAQEDSALEDPIPEPSFEQAAVTKPGDVWLLSKHRISCGNSLHEDTYRNLMGGRRAAVVFTDPPFNVKIDGHATGNGSIKHREFAMASGEMSEAEFVSFLNNSLRMTARYSANNSVHYYCMDWRHAGDLIAAGKQNYDEFLNMCVWVKDNGGMGSFYRSQHELILVFRKGKGPHRNNIQLGQFGRNRTNVWEYPGIHTFSKQGEEGNLFAIRDDRESSSSVDAGGGSSEPGELYFPLPANEAQREIAKLLDSRQGVLIQGPPGTGKSHTIANLICHLLATGKRLLVTSHTARALRVLKGYFPNEISPLCVSLLGDDAIALRELEESVQGILSRLNSWDPKLVRQEPNPNISFGERPMSVWGILMHSSGMWRMALHLRPRHPQFGSKRLSPICSVCKTVMAQLGWGHGRTGIPRVTSHVSMGL